MGMVAKMEMVAFSSSPVLGCPLGDLSLDTMGGIPCLGLGPQHLHQSSCPYLGHCNPERS